MLDTKRHRRVFAAELFRYSVHIIGCGGMGSRVAEGLVRMGVGVKDQSPITLYDGDKFAPHNLTNQWVTQNGIATAKVKAVQDEMEEINPEVDVTCVAEMVTGHVPLNGVVFLCLDSMSARRHIVDNLLAGNLFVPCVIETRMDAAVGISHCFNPANPNQLACWRMYWHSDREAQNLAGCSGPQSIISAIYGTTTLALKQFEAFARTGSIKGLPNRVYHDFDECLVHREEWPTA